jgi:hypothetical protein
VARVLENTRMDEMQSFQLPPGTEGEQEPGPIDRSGCEVVKVIDVPPPKFASV